MDCNFLSKGYQCINISCTSIIFLSTIGILIYTIIENITFLIIYSSIVILFTCKTLYNDTRIVNLFRGIHNDLELSIQDLNNSNMTLHSRVLSLEQINSQLQNNCDKYEKLNHDSRLENDNLKKHIQTLQSTTTSLQLENDKLTTQNIEFAHNNQQLSHLTNDLQLNISNLTEQNNDLKLMYIEATNLYKNLVIIGDSFSTFESKFSTTASQLRDETDTLHIATNDIRNATHALSTMVNTLADTATPDQQHLVKRSIPRTFYNVVLQVIDHIN